MRIAIRIDDMTPDMNWEKFQEFKELLDEYGVKPLVGVVPDNQDDNLRCGKEKTDFWNYIGELQQNGWIVALHGYQHIYSQDRGGMFPLNHFSEFAGLPFEKQKEMLEKGRKIFLSHNIKTDIFMAPAHSYDQNTLKALKQTGFDKITDGFGKSPYIWKGITFYPISFHLESSLKKKNGYTTMVVHTNTMTQADMKRYGRILAENQVISYGDYLRETAVYQGIFGRVWEYFLASIKYVLVRFR